jgi:hypothetical protein
MRKPIQMTAVTKVERNAATTLIMDAINASGGWVEDVHFFSNKMTAIRLVMDSDKIAALMATLEAAHIVTTLETAPTGTGKEVPGTLQVTFLHDEADLRREIPAVPG